MADFEAALAGLRQVLIDTNGDGVPDATMDPRGGVVTTRRPAPSPSPMPPSTMFGFDPTENMNQPGPDWQSGQRFTNMLGVTGASAADPFGIPSAALGMAYPGARDAWRGYQASEPVAAMAGGLAGGVGAAGMAFRGVRGMADAVGRGVALGAGSDAIDAGAGVPNAINSGTLTKVAMGGGMSLPLRYAAPLAGTVVAANSLAPGDAAAQSIRPEIDARLRSMSPAELRQYQSVIGVTPDGVLGPNTRLRAQIYEDQQANSQASKDAEARRQADADAVRIKAEAEGRAAEAIARERASSDLAASNAKRPFLERNPDYQTYALPAAAAAAFSVPLLAQVLTRRGATAPLRSASRDVNAAARRFDQEPNTFNALASRNAVGAYDDALAAVPGQSALPSIPEAALIGGSAALPSLSLAAPYLMDYGQPQDTPAKEGARKEFTLEGWKERLFGPTAAGAALAGLGYGIGRVGSRAFINPSPAAGALPRARTAAGFVGADDAVTTGNINSLMLGAQENAAALKGLQGVRAAEPPTVTYSPVTLPAPVTNPSIPVGPPSGGGGGSSGGRQPAARKAKGNAGASGPGPNAPSRGQPYGPAQQGPARALVDSEIMAGNPVPPMPAINNAIMSAGVPVPTGAAYNSRASDTAAIVADMQASGATPQAILAALQSMRAQGFPVIGATGAAGLGLNALYNDPMMYGSP